MSIDGFKAKIARGDIDRLVREIAADALELRRDALKIIRKYTELIEREAARLVPVDEGDLKRTIRSEVDEEELVGIILAGGTPDVWWQHWVELGTSKVRARPYMLPAFLRYQDDIFRELRSLTQ